MKHVILAIIGLAIALGFTYVDLGAKPRRSKNRELMAEQTVFEKQRHQRRW